MLIISLKLVLSLFFSLAASIKLTAWQPHIFEIQLKFFKKYGLNRQVMFAVGVIEASSVALFWLKPIIYPIIGALLIALTSLGAIYFHLRFDHFKDALAAIVTLTLSSILVFSLIAKYGF